MEGRRREAAKKGLSTEYLYYSIINKVEWGLGVDSELVQLYGRQRGAVHYSTGQQRKAFGAQHSCIAK